MINLKNLLLLISVLFSLDAQGQTTPQLVSSSKADTWVATDALGRSLSTSAKGIRKNKFVGLFYFVWQGAHGYDKHNGGIRSDEGVIQKTGVDTVSPYDLSKILAANPEHPQYGPLHAFHYWGEPYFGYYLPDDEWIIRKHAQMLSDAGVDVIVIDVTNAAIYLPQVTRIMSTYTAMRKQGLSTPGIAFIVNSNPLPTTKRLYDNIYAKGLYRDLWFYWKGKPLILAPTADQPEEIKNFFNMRQSWAWSKGQQWFGNGQDKWTWVDHTPQSFGWHEAPDQPEQISVSIAEHPISNIGRSFHDGKEPAEKRSGEGLYFAEQWQRAKAVDPEFVFVTGWNEWVAMRFDDGKARDFLGKRIKTGDTYFVDLYSPEYSRDAEPMKGGFNDNYYYQLVNNIRDFKGIRANPAFKTSNPIKIDGNFEDWRKVPAIYLDDRGDTFHRQHPGWGRITEYVNNTGRNDVVEARVAQTHDDLYFYVKTAAVLTSWQSANWMNLFISVKNSTAPDWEGFQYRVNGKPASGRQTSLERSKSGWQWEAATMVQYRYRNNQLELKIAKKQLGITGKSFVIDFKWSDNSLSDGNAMRWLDEGDAAPNGRFAYRYTFAP